MPTARKKIYYASAVFIVFGLSVVLQSLLAAWIPGSDIPPGNNTPGPLLSASPTQSLAGNFIINNGHFTVNSPFDAFFLDRTGIRTTNPAAALQAVATTSTEGVRVISSDYSPFIIRNKTDTADLFRIDQNGNVGIGAAPSSALSIMNGGISIGGVPQQGLWQSRIPKNNILTTITPGYTPSLTVGTDGLPIIAYHDTSFALKVVHCGDLFCSSNNTETMIAAAGANPSIAIGSNGLPIIAYQATGVGISVATCGSTDCSSGNTVAPLTASANEFFPKLAIGTDGLPLIVTINNSTFMAKITHCGNSSCSSGNTSSNIEVISTFSPASMYASIAIGTDGLPIVSYHINQTSDLKVFHCGNISCSSGNSTVTVDATNSVGLNNSITIGRDGFPVIAYQNYTNQYLRVAHCGNITCSSGNTFSNVDTVAGSGIDAFISIGPDGLPLVGSVSTSGNPYLRIIHCGNVSCSLGNSITTIDNGNARKPSITTGSDGLPIIAYYNNTSLKLAHCGSLTCQPYWTRR